LGEIINLTKEKYAVTIHDMLQSFDKKKQLDIAILDFSKAFDTVLHDRFLHKLNNYGIRGPLHAWLTTFLTKRKMRVSLEGEFLNEATAFEKSRMAISSCFFLSSDCSISCIVTVSWISHE
jgi:hypothetical protein